MGGESGTPAHSRQVWAQVPICAGCGQQEDSFPSVQEAKRVLEAHGWRRVPPATAWQDDHWAPGLRVWYCPPCRSQWDSARFRLQAAYRRRGG